MRLAILASKGGFAVTGAWPNGAHPKALPALLEDRKANGDAFPGEVVVRLPRRFAHMWPYQIAIQLGRSAGG